MRLPRTPEERFAGLPGFGYEPRYVRLAGDVRTACGDDGPPEGGTCCCPAS